LKSPTKQLENDERHIIRTPIDYYDLDDDEHRALCIIFGDAVLVEDVSARERGYVVRVWHKG
jgi:hypothetical protein